MRFPRTATALLAVALAACAGPTPPPAPSPPQAPTGILVMAHGGDPAWNTAVEAALTPLRDAAPVALAYGMADRRTLQAGIDSLAARGVERVAVVRMFLSGRSFEDQTLYLLGLSPTPPAFFLHHGGHGDHGGHGGDGGSGSSGPAPSDPPPPVESRGVRLATHREGLMDWEGVGAILLDRARSQKAAPGDGGILLLGHGMGDDDENRAVLDAMDAAAAALRGVGLGPVAVETLREDWPEARAEAETRIRAWVSASDGPEGPVIVPFRLSGFGPYADVLEGLTYRATDGLLPHGSVMDWVERTARSVACAEGWAPPTGSCGG